MHGIRNPGKRVPNKDDTSTRKTTLGPGFVKKGTDRQALYRQAVEVGQKLARQATGRGASRDESYHIECALYCRIVPYVLDQVSAAVVSRIRLGLGFDTASAVDVRPWRQYLMLAAMRNDNCVMGLWMLEPFVCNASCSTTKAEFNERIRAFRCSTQLFPGHNATGVCALSSDDTYAMGRYTALYYGDRVVDGGDLSKFRLIVACMGSFTLAINTGELGYVCRPTVATCRLLCTCANDAGGYAAMDYDGVRFMSSELRSAKVKLFDDTEAHASNDEPELR
jgi:hypothetical protein